MTAEIVVMNTRGIALATDSAVTIGGRKVYNSANKLFELTKEQPVGVMIYETDTFLNVPWETLIKVFRNNFGEHTFPKLQDYVDAFLYFLHENEYADFTDVSNEVDFIKDSLFYNLTKLHSQLSDIYASFFGEYGELHLQEDIEQLYVQKGRTFLNKRIEELSNKPYSPSFSDDDFHLIKSQFHKIIENYLREQLESHLFVQEWLEDMILIVVQSSLKELTDRYTGVVFAGFGNDEIYPSVVTLMIDGKVNGKIKYFISSRKTKSINHSLRSTIIPFAQRDVVESFITGIHVRMENKIYEVLENEFELLSHKLIDKLKSRMKAEVDLYEFHDEITSELVDMYVRFRQQHDTFKRENFIDPIVSIVEALPVNELAEMAEALLNITSLKRKMSISLETVGGPIDVAVITKGDGFIWVKRK